MKLVASMMVGANEQDRYLAPCVQHLLEFCDEVRVRHETVPGGPTPHPVLGLAGVTVAYVPPSFYEHEGRARQELLDWTLDADPTHILAIDADEFIADGQRLRASLEASNPDPEKLIAYRICMQEVWNARPGRLELRQDGGWAEHDVPIVWSPGKNPPELVMPDAQLACGRTPTALAEKAGGLRGDHTCTAILHFGWARADERAARYQRYVEHDGGRFHNSAHLDSIMWGDDKVETNAIGWPAALDPWYDEILGYALGYGLVYDPVLNAWNSPTNRPLLDDFTRPDTPLQTGKDWLGPMQPAIEQGP